MSTVRDFWDIPDGEVISEDNNSIAIKLAEHRWLVLYCYGEHYWGQQRWYSESETLDYLDGIRKLYDDLRDT